MSRLEDTSITLFDALQNIKTGKYVMPAFQRQYVWDMYQIEKLWDSILLDYPIATFLFWHVDASNVTEDTYFCSFLHEVDFNNAKQSVSPNYETTHIKTSITDTAILDGQQRLTSLFLSLLGRTYILPKHARKKPENRLLTDILIELNQNKLSIDEEEYNSKKFDIQFSEKIGRQSPTQFVIKNIMLDKFRNDETREAAIEETISYVPENSKGYARNVLNKLYNKIFVEKLVRFTEITDMDQGDALEMFVRFNSGGKALRKSEITMSILEAYWPKAKSSFGELLTGPYKEFSSDFIIRSALMLFGDVVKTNINKKMAEDLKNNWDDFKETLNNLNAVLKGMKIDVSRFSSSWNVLLPVLFFIYYNPDYLQYADSIKSYILRAILFTYFQSGTTSKLQKMKNAIIENGYKITIGMLNKVNELEVTDARIEDIVNSEKNDRVAEAALYYLSLDWLNKTLKYEQDHLHPDVRFDQTPPLGVLPADWVKWRADRNKLPNLHFLEGRSNGSKNDMSLADYYNDMNDEQKSRFHKQSFIPEGASLEIADFQEFYEMRKTILIEKLRELLG